MPPQPTENMEMLLEVGRLLSSKLDLPELLHTIMELAARVVNAQTASLLLLDPKSDELYFDVALGLDQDLAKARLKVGQGIAGAVAKDQIPVIINDVAKDPRWSPEMDRSSGFVTRSILASPIALKGRCIGVVEAINHIDGDFSFGDLRVFEAFASQAAVAIENARLFASLAEEKAKLNTLFNEMKDAAILTDDKGAVMLANAAARKFFSIGGADWPKTLAQAAQGMSIQPSLEAIENSEEALIRFEATRELPKKLVLAGVASLLREGESGRPTGRVIVFRDITEEKLEEGLKRSFLSLISHKLKTPLSSITGYSQLLLDDLTAKKGDAFALKAMGTISAQSQKLVGLVEKLLNYTVLEQLEASEYALEKVDVDQILGEAAQSMGAWLAEHGGEVFVQPGSGLTAYSDPALLRDVVKNLVENGVKFAPTGKRKISVWASPVDGFIQIHVKDAGPGIPPEEQDKIFNRFYQVEASFTGQVDGWGLGLSFVKRVVEKLGGTVRLQSENGKGSTFTVAVPSRAP